MGETSSKVDMLATARMAQWSADTFLGPGAVKLVAPAKVNLFLGVGARRADGYHDVTNIMHAVALHDVMYANYVPGAGAEGAAARGSADAGAPGAADAEGAEDGAGDEPWHAWAGPARSIEVTIDCVDKTGAPEENPLTIPVRDNIVFKAIDRLARALGRTEQAQVRVRLEKNIPHEGGLGGGSSDAAAILVALARWWSVAVDDAALVNVTRSLGADVAFFLEGGCALYDGVGEQRVRALEPAKDPLVLVKPPVGVSTPEAYRTFDAAPGEIPAELHERALGAECAADVPLFNNLAPASEQLAPVLADVRTWLAQQPGVRDASDVLLCGSGATTAAFTRDFSAACAIASAAQARGWWARATTLTSLRAAIVPQR